MLNAPGPDCVTIYDGKQLCPHETDPKTNYNSKRIVNMSITGRKNDVVKGLHKLTQFIDDKCKDEVCLRVIFHESQGVLWAHLTMYFVTSILHNVMRPSLFANDVSIS